MALRAFMVFTFLLQPVAGIAVGDDSVLVGLCQAVERIDNVDWDAARLALVEATRSIEAVWANSEQARQARQLWYEESEKPFKGEPYERAMAFYYLGLSYLRSGDWGNAQAAFYMSCLEDSFAEEEQHQLDFAAPLVLRAYALYRQGSRVVADEVLKLANRILDEPVALNPDSLPNTVVIIETGRSPRKISDGVGSYQLKFRQGKGFRDVDCALMVNDSPVEPCGIGDVFYQASTRGGRPVDAIIDGKVSFAKATGSIGLAFAEIGDLTSRDALFTESRAEQTAGYAMQGIGVAALLLSGSAKPAVDKRHWDNLPDKIHVAFINLEPGTHILTASYLDANGATISSPPPTRREVVVSDRSASILVWINSWSRTSHYLETRKP